MARRRGASRKRLRIEALSATGFGDSASGSGREAFIGGEFSGGRIAASPGVDRSAYSATPRVARGARIGGLAGPGVGAPR